jgi:hypothetical protein
MEVISTTIPHSDFGDPECWGCLNARIYGDEAELLCNECSVVRKFPATELQKTLDAMELEIDFSTAKCSRCGAVNILPGFSDVIAFICRDCGSSAARK